MPVEVIALIVESILNYRLDKFDHATFCIAYAVLLMVGDMWGRAHG